MWTVRGDQMTRLSIRVLIVDDHEVVRAGLKAVLDRQPDITVVASVGTGEEALEWLESAPIDIAILDQRLPGLNGVDICRIVQRRFPRTSALMLTCFASDEVVHACLAAGARGYLTKDGTVEDLPSAVRTIASGGAVLAPAVIERLVDMVRRPRGRIGDDRTLNQQELEVLSLLAQGCSTREICDQLQLGEYLVKLRVTSMMRKLKVKSRAEVVARALKVGLL